jgi:hypothetical protein
MCGSCDNTKPIQLSDDRDENDIPIPMETIEPPPAMHSTTEQPILPREYRDIIWELRRRILEGLPDVDVESEDAAHQFKANIVSALDNVTAPIEVTEWIETLNIETLRLLYDFISASLPDANGNVVAFNPVLTACCASNTAAYPLGNTTQANSSCFYVSPYMGKQKAAVDVILSPRKVLKTLKTTQYGRREIDSRTVTFVSKNVEFLSRKLKLLHPKSARRHGTCTDNFSYFDPTRPILQ